MIQKTLRKARHGTKVKYIVGNHDDVLRKFLPLHFGDIEFANRVLHVSADNKKYIVVHGDAWDGVMKYAPWLSKVGAIAYSFLLEFNVVINFFRRLFKKGNWSLAKYLNIK